MAGISYNLARGHTPDCHCFGQLHSAPIGWPTLARNGILVIIAAFVFLAGYNNPGLSAVGWVGALTIGERIGLAFILLVGAALAVQGWLLYHILQQNGRLLLRVEALEASRTSVVSASEVAQTQTVSSLGLQLGTVAPGFSLPELSGEILTLDVLRAPGKPIVLIFVDPDCGPCTGLLPDVGRWQREYRGKLTVALIGRGNPEANRLKIAEHGVNLMLLQHNREVAQVYQAHSTPSAVLVGVDGTIGSQLAQGTDAVCALVAGAIDLPTLGAIR
jgi:peroxiredoxin